MTKKIARREALKFGLAGVAGLAVVSVVKETVAAEHACNGCTTGYGPHTHAARLFRTMILPMPPLELSPGATVFWSTEPLQQEAFRPDNMLLDVAETAAHARQGLVPFENIAKRIELRRMMVGEKDQFVGLLPSSLADLPDRAAFNGRSNILSVDLRGVALPLELNHPLVLEIHNPTDQVWHLRGIVFGNKTPAA